MTFALSKTVTLFNNKQNAVFLLFFAQNKIFHFNNFLPAREQRPILRKVQFFPLQQYI